MKLAAELAAEEINAAGGINGRPIELVARDDYADPDSAVFIANDLYEADVTAVVGHLFSGPTLAAAPVYNGGLDPVVAISPSSSSPEVSTAGDYTFRVCPSDLAHGAALAQWTYQRLGYRRGAVLYLNDQYGRGIRQTFVQEFSRLGGEAPVDRSVPRRQARRRSLPRPPGCAIAPSSSSSRATGARREEIIRQARRRGLTIPVLGGDGLEGIHEAGAWPRASISPPPTSRRSPTDANRRFVEAYRRKYPDARAPNQPAAATYDAHLPAARGHRAVRTRTARRCAARWPKSARRPHRTTG